MVFLKSLLAGILGLSVYLFLLALALWYGPILWLHWQMWRSPNEGGTAAFGFVLSPVLLIPGLVVFAAAFRWEWKRASLRSA
jgi:hypothetical protein